MTAALIPGCKKRPATAAPAATQPAPANPTTDLPNLTIAVRAYVMTQGKPPTSLEDLVKAGCIPRLPTAPAGKKYAIDGKKAEAVLVNE
ncbi:MAG: hypothetical protein HZA92_07105 [Verrucomicrobia bacterium]|nr:hypothetical protein [Verrucomicrobiota bacterium]